VTTVILRQATRVLLALLILFSIFLLLRGHHHPGGGFVGGLVFGGGFGLYAFAFTVRDARNALRADPYVLIGGGLLLALASALLATLEGFPFFTGVWGSVTLPLFGSLDIGTPLFFDMGVFLVVSGVTVTILFALGEER
jgi:multicomponent Na+:H+ antiporter subunit B